MIVVITGPTGVGKTKLSEELAIKYNAIIINADAVQVYKKLDIGSAKVTKEEMLGAKHYLFDILDVTGDYSVKDYQIDVRKIISDNSDKNIILVGGTGLYISAALYDYEFEEENREINYSCYTDEEIYNMALLKDPAMDIHKNNRIRLERFLIQNNKKIKGKDLLYKAMFIGLTTPRENLYKKINDRVDNMFENGLLNEVQSLYHLKDKSRVLNSAIGYKEVISYLDKIITKEDMLDLIKKNSRRYAKRQYTWFNNKMDIKWFNVDYDNFNNTINEVYRFLEDEGL